MKTIAAKADVMVACGFKSPGRFLQNADSPGASLRQLDVAMKRAFFEWSAIGMSALTIMCFGYWAVSKTTDAADSKMRWRFVDASIADGTVTLADQLDNWAWIECIEKSIPVFPLVKPTGKYRLNIPGFELHFITVARHHPVWRIESSLLIPAAILMLGAAFSILEYLKARNAIVLVKVPATNSEAAAHPLD